MFRSLLSFASQNPFASASESSSVDKTNLFPTVDPEVDGPDCDKDCADCTTKFPSRFKVNSDRELYGSIKPYTKHVIVATGKTDWEQRVENERGSLMEGFKLGSFKPKTGKMMVSASNLPVDRACNDAQGHGQGKSQDNATTVLVLPAFIFVDAVTVSRIPEFMDRFIDSSPDPVANAQAQAKPQPQQLQDPASSSTPDAQSKPDNGELSRSGPESPHKLTTRPCLRDHLILLCSHHRRDARCGISAPLIRRELERHLRPLGLYRDDDDSRPGGVGIVYVSHVGGHKFAANVLIYRRAAEQMIWLARVRPADCEGIVKQTVLKGKIVHADQLRGGFDRGRDVASW
ncbi:sucrase/ferredoxin domain-containing protein [Histoplasma capsulatum var. duboisii H88]|uniref:Sucrase/ferredoxin domain-containing protein n=1 Tax=Ajellomyces capsulatus (strain H88) TaxID=544711 RepID=F0UFM8_AJEC8|nr:sucrase/ferredoxin domain-containing protein [Histoplasma capsulatum var. duboisii H88]